MPDLTVTLTEPVSLTIQALCNATIAVCHTIDAQTAAMTPEQRQANAALHIEQLKPWLALAKWFNKLLGIE